MLSFTATPCLFLARSGRARVDQVADYVIRRGSAGKRSKAQLWVRLECTRNMAKAPDIVATDEQDPSASSEFTITRESAGALGLGMAQKAKAVDVFTATPAR